MATTTDRQTPVGQIVERLYARHRHRLLAIASANSAGLDDAEEALQDALVLFLRHFDPADGAPALPWLVLTLKRRCWAIYRRRLRVAAATRRAAREMIPATPRPPEEAAEDAELLDSSRRALAGLKPAERRALGLLALGYRYREIVAITDWSYTKVNRLIRDGRASLRRSR